MSRTKVTSGVLANNAIDNSKIAANTITTAQLHSTFTLDGVTEGANELYFTTARANSAIDARVTKSFVDALAVSAGSVDGIDSANLARTDIAETFTANVSGPTQANTDNSTLLATTAFVNNAIVIDRNIPLNHSSNGRYVKVTVTAAGGKYYIDGTQQAHVSLQPGFTYRFDLSDSSNASHPFRFSTTENGTHNGGSAYTTGVTEVGTAGSAGSYTEIIVEMDTPTNMYYYCGNHNAMGATVSVGGDKDTDNLVEGSTNLYYTNARADARIALQVGANLDLSSKSTTNLSEGTNLYYTNARADARIALQVGSNLDISNQDTGDLAEGTNLYYTVARANSAIDARVTKSFVDALNVDADTLDGNDSTYFAPIASPALTGTPTAPTAANTVNTTQLATTEFVTNKITNLIDGAPGTLDTLNELAAAINDDSNYNSTLTTALATKMPLAGGTFTGNVAFNDSVYASFGNSGDLKIFHDTNHSEISESGQGDLRIRGDSVWVLAANGQNQISAAAGVAKLYNSGNEKLATTSTGATINGTSFATSSMRAGNVYVSSSGSIYRTDTAGAGGIHITTNAIYPGNSSGGIVNGSTSLGASGYRFNTLFSSGVDNSGTISTNDLVVSGNLTVTGTTSQSTTTQSTTSANNMTLLSTVTGSPTANASFEIERGSATNAKLLWDETLDRFYINNALHVDSVLSSDSLVKAQGNVQMGHDGTYGTSGTGRYVAIGFGNGLNDGTNRVFAHNTGEDGLFLASATSRDIIFRTGGTTSNTFRMTSGGDFQVLNTKLIDSSRNIYPASIHSTGKMSFLNGSAAQGIRVNTLYAGTTYANDGAASGQVDALNGYRVGGTVVIDSSRDMSNIGTINSEDIHIKSGTSGTNTQGLLFTLTDNGDAQAFIKKTAYYMHYNANSNEGHRFSVSGTNDLLRLHGDTNSTRPESVDILATNGLYMNNTQVMTQARALVNVSGNISQFTNDSGYITSADGGNAGLLDGLDSSDYLRRGNYSTSIGGTPSASNLVRFENASGQSMNTASSYKSRLECYNGTSGADAFMSFHVSGDYALYFGLDGATNDISVGGWSMGANKYRIYHAGNIGSQSVTIGTLGVTNDLTPSSGIQMRRDQSAGIGISWYTTSYTSWATYMATPGTTGCGASSNITAAASAHGVTSWALRNFIENASGYGYTWEAGTATGTPSVIMGLSSSTGNLSVGGTVTANSDRRIKKNIVTIDNALDKVLKLRGVTFQRTDTEDDKVLMGVVAQEVEEVIPEVVSLGDADDPDSIKSVSYGNMVGVLIEAIKEQQKQIDELKKQIENK